VNPSRPMHPETEYTHITLVCRSNSPIRIP
jgi:hypothetical protein